MHPRTVLFLLALQVAPPAQEVASDGVPVHVLPPVDVVRLSREDAARGNWPFRYGTPLACELDTQHSGAWELGSELVWRLAVRSQGALSLGATFDPFEVPGEARLVVTDRSGATVLGPFTQADRDRDGRLSLPPLPGDELRIVYTQPREILARPRLALAEVIHDYHGVLDDFRPDETYELSSGLCFVDANCAEGLPYQEHKRSVVRILIDGWLCSGTLMNNTAEDRAPYVLTARHCFQEGLEGANISTQFLYEYRGCSPEPRNVAGRWIRGATFLAGSTRYDQALLRLHSLVPDDYLPRYAGWDRHPDFNSGPGICIGHPLGRTKKIAIDYDDFPRQRDVRFWIAQWEVGMVDQGSSGSSIINSDGLVFGVCSRESYEDICLIEEAWFTRFPPFWDEEALERWLDPLGDDPETLEPFDPLLARADAELGTGVNPADLVSTRPPRLGKVWTAAVDLTRQPGATSTWLFGHLGPRFLNLPLGELLIDLRSPRAFYSVAGRDGDSSPHEVDIPADPLLAGTSVFTQALVLDTAGPRALTNAYRLFLE